MMWCSSAEHLKHPPVVLIDWLYKWLWLVTDVVADVPSAGVWLSSSACAPKPRASWVTHHMMADGCPSLPQAHHLRGLLGTAGL